MQALSELAAIPIVAHACTLEQMMEAFHTVWQQILTIGSSNVVGRLEGASDDEAQRHEQVIHEWDVHLASMLQAGTLLLSTPSECLCRLCSTGM